MQWILIVALLHISPLLASSRSQVHGDVTKTDGRRGRAVLEGAREMHELNDVQKKEEDGGTEGTTTGMPLQGTSTTESLKDSSRAAAEKPGEAAGASAGAGAGDGSRYRDIVSYMAGYSRAGGEHDHTAPIVARSYNRRLPEGFVYRIPMNSLASGRALIDERKLCNGTRLPDEEWCNDCMCLSGQWYCSGKWCHDHSLASHTIRARGSLFSVPAKYWGVFSLLRSRTIPLRPRSGPSSLLQATYR